MTKNRITVTKPHLPAKKRFYSYVEKALDSRWFTNDGPLVRELTERVEDYLGTDNLLLVANGTLGLLIALKVANSSRVFTTPFSFPATTSAPLWSGIDVEFGDICPESFNLLPPPDNSAPGVDCILPTHVFGNPCDLDAMKILSKKWSAPILYDAAHAFGVKVDGKSILEFGDMSVLSFHATKLFHCVEGGAIRFSSEEQLDQAREMINFGFDGEGNIKRVGINAKMNELEAAMGLAVLDDINEILNTYRINYELYNDLLDKSLQRQKLESNVEHNYSYFPICFRDSDLLERVVKNLRNEDIYPRRYFEPSLDEVAVYGRKTHCEVSRDLASRILCLPMYSDLAESSVRTICGIVNRCLDSS